MDIITLSHGSGGKLTHELIEKVFYPHFANEILLEKNDAATLPWRDQKIAMTTDSYVIDPIFFPGGDIGKLAVCGTVNDLAMGGATPLYITVAFILEEGLPIPDLERVVISMAKTARDAGIQVVAGDTKVVERGRGHRIYINTTGIGRIDSKIAVGGQRAKIGDRVIISGTIGDHGMAIFAARNGFGTRLESDCDCLHELCQRILQVSHGIRVLRDPTRGGVATTLNEIAQQSQAGIVLYEKRLPIRQEVKGLCDILGMDPLYAANEGKMLVIVAPEDEEKVLKELKNHPMGKDASVIGEVVEDRRHWVGVKTSIGGTRMLPMLSNELLPRIC